MLLPNRSELLLFDLFNCLECFLFESTSTEASFNVYTFFGATILDGLDCFLFANSHRFFIGTGD